MVPIEIFMLTLWLLFVPIGIARAFPRELGASIGFIGMLLLFNLGGTIFLRIGQDFGDIFTLDPNLVTLAIYTMIILMTVVALYAGETLAFSGVWPPGRGIGTAIDVSTALFNGWLVVGSWWYYMDALEYPQRSIGMFQPPISNLAEQMVLMTPQAVIPEAQATWIIGMALLFLLALKVAR